MPKLTYRHTPTTHNNTILVEFSAPALQFEKYRRWLDFCLDRYPITKTMALNVRYQKRDTFLRIGKLFECFGGWFNPKYEQEVDISVCVGKTQPMAESEVMFTFFHEYGHFLQYDQGRFGLNGSEDIEADADMFAEKAIALYEGRCAI